MGMVVEGSPTRISVEKEKGLLKREVKGDEGESRLSQIKTIHGQVLAQ